MTALKDGPLGYEEAELERHDLGKAVGEKEEEAFGERRMRTEGELDGQDGLRSLSGVSLEKLHPARARTHRIFKTLVKQTIILVLSRCFFATRDWGWLDGDDGNFRKQARNAIDSPG